MFCLHCGKELPDGSTVCFECGAAQNKPTVVETPNMDYAQPSTAQPTVVPQTKSKIVAGLLALFLGGLGLHDFYLGNTGRGILKIVLSCVSASTISTIWGWIDCYKIFTGQINQDAQGNPLF